MPTTGLSSFRMRLLIGVLIPVLLIQSANIIYEMLTLRDTYMQALRAEGSLMSKLVGQAMVQPMWDFDIAQVQNMANTLIDEGRIGQTMVVGPSNNVIVSGQSQNFTPHADDVQVSHSIFYLYDGNNEYLGQLKLTLPIAGIMSELHASVIRKLLTSAMVMAIIGVAVFLVLSRISRPLAEITAAITNFRLGKLKGPIPGENRTDEIGMVAQALAHLRANEAEVAELRAQSDERTRRETKRIRRALDSTRDGVLLAGEDGEIVFCNPNAGIFFGGARVGDPLGFQSWLPGDVAVHIEDCVAQNDDFAIEASVVHDKTGESLSLLVRGGAIRDEDGSLLGTVLLGTDHSEQAKQAKRAKYLSEHDSLTGLPNRRLMEETLSAWLQDEAAEVSILLADLDQFKQINDTLGHPVGDALLVAVAQKFKGFTEVDILAARLGGDEFAILVKGKSSADRLNNIAMWLIDEIAKPQTIEDSILHTGMSAGISTVVGPDVKASEGIRRADLALYEAKNSGRGRVKVFHEDLETAIKRKSLLERELRAALKTGDIYPVFQVQTDLQTGEIAGFEALARWQHDKLGQISPGEFIPVAEEAGLIKELTYQITINACKAAAVWRAGGFMGRVAINLSPKLFGMQVDEFVNDCLFETNCPAAAIEAEITETVVLSNRQSALHEIEALQRLGVTVALDDFGMGYSSLSYLQKFPVDKIKVDSAFVSILPNSAETRAIVVAIAELGHALGMKVTGEGAETELHRRLLRECKVDFLQGYVDGFPLTQDEATAILSSVDQRQHL